MLNRERKFERAAKAEAERAEKDAADSLINKLKSEVEELKGELKAAEYERLEADKNRDILASLYEQDLIDREENKT